MKKILFYAITAAGVFSMTACSCSKKQKTDAEVITHDIHNSRNSLDWAGTYSGTVPCADCPGIDIILTLNENSSYSMSITYQDRKGGMQYSGDFTWDDEGSKVDLQNVNEGGAFQHFFVQENGLLLLTPSGEIVSGESEDKYVLPKIEEISAAQIDITNRYWKLVELAGKPVKSAENLPEAFIIFKTDGSVHGNLACNSFNGTYTLQEGNRIRFAQLTNTLKMCLNMEIENGLSKVLQTADNYNLNDGKLVLNRARMAPLARFEAVYMK